MKHNIGRWERVIRVIAGSALVVLGWIYLEGFGIGAASLILVPVGTVMLLTGVFSFCPLNVLFHHNSCRQGVRDKHIPI